MRVAPMLAALCLAASHAAAAELDCTQVKLIVPYPAGGATDVAARVVGERLEASLKKSVVIETRPGATGNIGTAAVIGSKPDGCTLLVNAAVIATFPYSFGKLDYDPINDLAPIGGIGVTPTLLVSAPAVGASDVGFDPTPTTPEETADIVRKTGETWAPLIKHLNIRLD